MLAFITSYEVCLAQTRIVTVNEIRLSLQDQGKLHVGFDIDDTLLFSSPGFYNAVTSLCNGNFTKCAIRDDFWYKINNGADDYSLPKEIAFELIKMHQERGDNIFYITARAETKEEVVTPLIEKIFSIEKMNNVIFTGGDKTQAMLDNDIQIYYGDADGDMLDAQSAKARPIRVLRAKNSMNKQLTNVGKFNEEVVFNSEF